MTLLNIKALYPINDVKKGIKSYGKYKKLDVIIVRVLIPIISRGD